MVWNFLWQIVGPVVGILGIGVTVFLVVWTRREKIVIQYPHVFVQLKTNGVTGIQFEYWFSLIYIKGVRDYFVGEIWIELDKRLWGKLLPYFKIYRRMSRGYSQDELPKLEIGNPRQFGHDNFFPAQKAIKKEELEKLENLIQELWYKYKIGWKDTYGKVHWKSINQLKDIKKSFKKAM